MNSSSVIKLDPNLDLILERIIDVPRDLVWAAWTQPEHVKKWFTPAPWSTVECEIDLRPGGVFRTVMRSPEGQDFPHLGCYLEIVPVERLVWTNALGPGFRPLKAEAGSGCAELVMTGLLELEAHGEGTKYRAAAIHGDAESSRKHAEMGFEQGWGAVLDQLVAAIKEGRIKG